MGETGIQVSESAEAARQAKRDPYARWRDLIERSKAADAGKGPAPTLLEMSDAMSSMQRSGICNNRDIAAIFGWPADEKYAQDVSRYCALQGLLPAVRIWLLANPEAPLPFFYRIATKKGEDQFAAFEAAKERWANPSSRARILRAHR